MTTVLCLTSLLNTIHSNKFIKHTLPEKMETDSDTYFAEYEDLEIHDLMLKDRPRQEAYFRAIYQNRDRFRGKTVLDVGAGTGILSAFCAKAGAKLVFAVEASNLAKIALEVIEENQLTPVVKVIHSKIENFKIPKSFGKVDIIVSEWMGFYLLHEGMLDSVIYARDNFLKPDGLMFPQEATIYISPCSVPSLYNYYKDVDGIQMTSFAKKLRAQKSSKPEIFAVKEKDLLASGNSIFHINLPDITVEDLEQMTSAESMVVETPGRFEGFCIWFEVRFPYLNEEEAVYLITGPDCPETHWKQCLVVLPEDACMDVVKDEPICFEMTMRRSEKKSRRYNLEIELNDPNVVDHSIPCNCYMTKCILMKAHLERIRTGELSVNDYQNMDSDG